MLHARTPHQSVRILAVALSLALAAIVAGPALPARAAPLIDDGTIPVGGWPEHITVSPDGQTLWVTDTWNDRLVVVDVPSRTVVETFSAGFYPGEVVISPDAATAYFADTGSDVIRTFDTEARTELGELAEVMSPEYLGISPDGSTLYALAGGSGHRLLSVIDTTTGAVVEEITVGYFPLSLDVSPDGSTVYVANSRDNTVSAIDTETYAIENITVGDVAFPVVVSPDGQTLYVAEREAEGAGYAKAIRVVDTTTHEVIEIINTGVSLWGLAVAPDGGAVYATASDDGMMVIVDTATHSVAATVALSGDNYGIAVAPNGTIYVGSERQRVIEVFRPAVTVTFDANGGAGTMAPQTFAAGTATTLSANTFTYADYEFTGWNTVADGSGQAYADEAVDDFVAGITLYAQWSSTVIDSLAVHGPTSVTELDTAPYSVEALNNEGDTLGDVTDQVTFASNVAGDQVADSTVTFGHEPNAIGTDRVSTITATLVTDPSITADLDVAVASAAIGIDMVAPASATQGDTITVSVNALDDQGRVLSDVTSLSVITSSVATDEITGNQVHFVDASPHVLTAAVPGLPDFTASVTVEVAAVAAAPVEVTPAPDVPTATDPEPSELATTGASPQLPLTAAVVLCILGGLGLVGARALNRREMSESLGA